MKKTLNYIFWIITIYIILFADTYHANTLLFKGETEGIDLNNAIYVLTLCFICGIILIVKIIYTIKTIKARKGKTNE